MSVSVGVSGGFVTNGSTTTRTSVMNSTSNGSAKTPASKMSLMHSNGWHPKLNGLSGGGQGLERRGTNFSTLDFYQTSVGSTSHNNAEFYSREQSLTRDGLEENQHAVTAMDYYDARETSTQEGRNSREEEEERSSVDDVSGDGAVDYYETSQTSSTRRTEEQSHVTEEQSHVTDDVAVYRARSTSSSNSRREERSSSSSSSVKRETVTSDRDEFTYL